MDHQSTSEEQFLEIKEFLANTWKIIVAVIIIGLLAMWGWRYWQTHKSGKITESSDQYEQLIAKLDSNSTGSIDELIAFAKNNDTIYSVFANLRAAQFYVESRKDYTGAKALLDDALNKSEQEPIQSIINIRIARLQYQLAQYQESLATLDNVTENSWNAAMNDVKGDVLTKLTRYDDAINAYNIALMSSPTPDLEKNIKMKLNEAQYLKTKMAAVQEK